MLCRCNGPLAAFLALATCGTAAAGDPHADYNRARAYRHFLTSPYATRTFSSGTPGYAWGYSTPWGYGGQAVSPTYHHERISPHGWERYQTPAVVSGYHVPRPVLLAPLAPLPPLPPLWP